MTALATIEQKQENILGQLITKGNLAMLSEQNRIDYYYMMCDRYGLDPLSKPFDYITTKTKDGEVISLYPNTRAAAQMRANQGISVSIASRELLGDVYMVTAKAIRRDGTFEECAGCVPIYKDMAPQAKANAYMKAETAARRRATIAACGMADSEGDITPVDAKDGGLEPSADVLDAEVMEPLSKQISAKIAAIPGLTSEAVAELLKENGIDPKKVDKMPASRHGEVLALIDAMVGVTAA
jgi:hypothetical protein